MARGRSRLRRWVLWLAGIGALVVVGVAGVVAYSWYTAPVDTVGMVAFEQPLAVPPLATSTVDADGRRVFDLTGPTLRAERGEVVLVNFHNGLDEATTVHWHGMHLPARMDGGPHQMVDPGRDWSPTWKIDQPAATLWYHPHPHGATRDHVNRGLAGMFILDDPTDPASRALPHAYGVDDIPVIVQDRSFDDSGGLNVGNLGDVVLVNGTYGPFLDVTTEALRLRVLNASAARVYNFGLSDDREFSVVGSDGGLLPEPVTARRLVLSPGERGEIVVRIRPSETVVLRSYEPDLGVNAFARRFDGGKDRFDVLELRAADNLTPSATLPNVLAPAPDLVDGPPDEVEVDRTFTLQGNKINGRSMDMARIDEVVEVNTTEVWQVENTDGTYHNLHVHDVQFQVLTINGDPPPGRIWRLEGHRLPGAGNNSPPGAPVQRLHRSRSPVHAALSPTAARGPGNDGPDRRGQAR